MAMLSHTLSVSTGVGTENGLRDPSFSSYLNGAEKSFVLNLAKQCKVNDNDDDGEIGVFSAAKYFNESLDDEKLKPVTMVQCVENTILPAIRSMNESRATSVRSGSSGNSQSALLHRAVRDQPVNGASKVRGRGGGGYLGSFRCRCVCSDKNSVAVDEGCGESLTLSQRAAKESMKKVTSPVIVELGPKREIYLISKDLPVEELPRKSLEVFGVPVQERVNKPSLPFVFQTEKKLKLNWEDEFPKPAHTALPMTVHAVSAEYDSDASSDLFEIEDFTGKVKPFLSRQVSRNMSGSATPPAGYAPSEASIEWSVVTASAADYSIKSDYEELKSGKSTTYTKPGSTAMNKKVTAIGDKPRRLSNSFLACNSQDSVKVVDHAHKAHEKISDQKVATSQDFGNQDSKPRTAAMVTGTEPVKNTRVGISSKSVTVSNSIHGQNMLF